MPIRTRLTYFRTSFRFKLFSVFTLLTALASIIVCTLYITSEISETRGRISDQLRLEVRYLGDSIRLPLYAENSEALNQLATETLHLPEIKSVQITARDGKVLVHAKAPDATEATGTLSETAEVHSNPLINHAPGIDLPVSDNGNSLIGTVTVIRGTHDLSRLTSRLILVSCSIAIGFWLLASLFSYLVLRQVTRSFNALMKGIDAMQAGDFTSPIDVLNDDEPGRAAHAINNLANALQQRSDENNRLQEERLIIERKMFSAQKLESLGIMAGGIAHDYNNLLQAILGNIELAAMKIDPGSAAHKYIANAQKSGNRAANLTNLMLTYVGRGCIDKKELNLNDVIKENADLLYTAIPPTISTKLLLTDELPPIQADETQIQQLVMNLIINAAEAIEKPSGLIKIATGVQDFDHSHLNENLLGEKLVPGRYLFLEVSDNGCGMNPETLARLFDPFFTTKFTGRGLGMSAVMGIIRLHSGALFVQSEPDMGTTFKVLFPASGEY